MKKNILYIISAVLMLSIICMSQGSRVFADTNTPPEQVMMNRADVLNTIETALTDILDVVTTNGKVTLSSSGLIIYEANTIRSIRDTSVDVGKSLISGMLEVNGCSVRFTLRSFYPTALTVLPFESKINTAFDTYVADNNICVQSISMTPTLLTYVYHTVAKPSSGSVNTQSKNNLDISSKGGGIVPACPASGCGFDQLIQLINNIIKFLLFEIATPLIALILVYVGWLYLSSGGNEENVNKAKKILWKVIEGYVWGLAAWLIIKTILWAVSFNGPMFLN